jgi:hypothetical protein
LPILDDQTSHFPSVGIRILGFAVLMNKQKNRAMKRSLGLLLALTLSSGVAPIGGANAATPKVGSKCTKANQKVKVSNESYLCSKSGQKLVWVRSKSAIVSPNKTVAPTPSQSPSPVTKTDSNQSKTAEPVAPAAPVEKKTTTPTQTPAATKTPSPSPAPATSSGQSSSGSSASAQPQQAPSPQASPSPSASPENSPMPNVIETKPVSLKSPTITGIKNGDIPKIGQVLSCSDWKWDQVLAQTIISWIAYPSNTGSDVIDPKLYMTLSEAVALTESNLEISAANIEKVSGNYLYCFARGMTARGLETTSIAAILLGK